VVTRMFRCDTCGANESEKRLVSESFLIDGKPVLVEGIPARACLRCGETVFSRGTTKKIRRTVHGHAQPRRSVQVDVFEYA